MAVRQSKFEPRFNKPNLIFQPRDLEIIESVYHYRYLRRDQIQKLLNWRCTTRINTRLRKLFDNDLISRTYLPTVKGSSQAIYFLGKKAVNIVSEQLKIPPEEVKKKIQSTQKPSSLFLNHSLLVSEARMKLNEAFNTNGIRVSFWLSDLDCVDHFRYENDQGRIIKRHFKPDGYCQFIYAQKIYSLFLEVDTGEMGHKRISHKVKIYQEYKELGLCTQRFGLTNFRILFVVNSQIRAKSLKSTLEADHRKNTWFVDLKDLTSDSIFKKHWHKTFETEPVRFLQLDERRGTT